MLVLIKGAGDLATGVALRLRCAGMRVVMTEVEAPTAVRRTVAFSQCVYDGTATVEGRTARRCSPDEVDAVLAADEIPVVAPTGGLLAQLPFDAVVDAILAKENTGTSLRDAARVVALGPGFTAGVDCHAVVETMRGHDLGRVIWDGSAAPNTGVPGEVGGYTTERLLRAPCAGVFAPLAEIGQTVATGEVVAQVSGVPVTAGIGGIVRGLLPSGLAVTAGMKAGDIDPRCERRHCFTVSDKARAVGGGVLEALLKTGDGYEMEPRSAPDGGIVRKGGGEPPLSRSINRNCDEITIPADCYGTPKEFRNSPPSPVLPVLLPRLILCGGGHVSLALARLASTLDFSIVVMDDRAEFVTAARFPMAARRIAAPYSEALEAVRPDADDYICILTRGHAFDSECAARVLPARCAYVGMIGSKRKVALAREGLLQAGFPGEWVDSLHAPIGIDIAAETPEEIAVSIAAQLIAARAARGGGRSRLPSGPGVEVVIVEKVGSAPRGVGASMLVRPDGTIAGTVGGGRLEHLAVQEALALLQSGGGGYEKPFHLSGPEQDPGMVCGGRVILRFARRGA